MAPLAAASFALLVYPKNTILEIIMLKIFILDEAPLVGSSAHIGPLSFVLSFTVHTWFSRRLHSCRRLLRLVRLGSRLHLSTALSCGKGDCSACFAGKKLIRHMSFLGSTKTRFTGLNIKHLRIIIHTARLAMGLLIPKKCSVHHV